jgi:hypothetical protein
MSEMVEGAAQSVHVAALIKKLESESERMTRTDLFRRSLEATKDISYPLPTMSGLVAQPSQKNELCPRVC